MKLYRIYQTVNKGYDTYSDAVVCAVDEEDAKTIHPDDESKVKEDEDFEWCPLKDVQVQYIGEADDKIERGVIVSSYHAG